MTGKNDEVKDDGQGEQLSPFHTITIARCTAVVLPTDSPRAVAPKVQKSSTSVNNSITKDHPAAATKARRGKDTGRKKTSNATYSDKLEVNKNVDKVQMAVDGKIVNVSLGKDATEGVETESGKSDVALPLSVFGKTDDQSEVTSDVEQSLPDRDMVKGRRCASVPVRSSR